MNNAPNVYFAYIEMISLYSKTHSSQIIGMIPNAKIYKIDYVFICYKADDYIVFCDFFLSETYN